MKGNFFGGVLGSVLAIAASGLRAAAPVDGGTFPDSNVAAIDSSFAPEVDRRAAGTEEVTPYGAPHVLRLDDERLKTEMRELVRIVNERLKVSIEMELKQPAAPKLKLASETRSAVDLPPA